MYCRKESAILILFEVTVLRREKKCVNLLDNGLLFNFSNFNFCSYAFLIGLCGGKKAVFNERKFISQPHKICK